MPTRHNDLFGEIANFAALHAAWRKAIQGKRRKPGAAAFTARLETNLLRLERELKDGTWQPGRFVTIEVRDPKHRIVSAAPFRDRVVHHALCAVVAPIFERGFIDHSYANREGKGTHRAVRRYERWRDGHSHVLRCDIYRYFPAIDHAVLKSDLRRRIACADTLWLLDTIIDGSNPQEPVHLYYPGDDLFTPFTRRRGLPIGNLTSQFFANVHLDALDHFATEVLRAPYLRYVDDFALFANDPAQLADWRDRIAGFLARRRLTLHSVKTVIQPSDQPAVFLGYELAPHRRRLAPANVTRFRNRLRGLRDRWRHGSLNFGDVETRVGAWIAHASFAQTWRLRQSIFAGGWFDPAAAKPGCPPAAGPCGAVPGTTIQGTSAPPTATGTTPATGTRTPVSAWPARLHAGAARFKDRTGAPRVRSGMVMTTGGR
ncbi:MAG: reverse transcriptase domain-containing protein [Acetobacteraceae bacterium]